MSTRWIEIEFIEDTFGPDGDVLRSKGDRFRVDQMSAHSFVDVRKVAKRVAVGPTISTTKYVPPERKFQEVTPDEPDDGG